MQNCQQYNMLPPNCSMRICIYKHYFITVILNGHVQDLTKATTISSGIENNMTELNSIDNNPSNSQAEQSDSKADLQAQVIELQMNLSHLEVTIERLDEVITRQDRDIQTLQRQVQFIYKQVQSQDGEGGVAPFDVIADRPPHY